MHKKQKQFYQYQKQKTHITTHKAQYLKIKNNNKSQIKTKKQ